MKRNSNHVEWVPYRVFSMCAVVLKNQFWFKNLFKSRENTFQLRPARRKAKLWKLEGEGNYITVFKPRSATIHLEMTKHWKHRYDYRMTREIMIHCTINLSPKYFQCINLETSKPSPQANKHFSWIILKTNIFTALYQAQFWQHGHRTGKETHSSRFSCCILFNSPNILSLRIEKSGMGKCMFVKIRPTAIPEWEWQS